MAKRKQAAGERKTGSPEGPARRSEAAGVADARAEAVEAALRDGLTADEDIAAYVKKFYRLDLAAEQVAAYRPPVSARPLPHAAASRKTADAPRRGSRKGAPAAPRSKPAGDGAGAEPSRPPAEEASTSAGRARPEKAAPRRAAAGRVVTGHFVEDMGLLADLQKRYGGKLLADMLQVFDRLA